MLNPLFSRLLNLFVGLGLMLSLPWGCRRLEIDKLDFIGVGTKRSVLFSPTNVGIVLLEGVIENSNGNRVSQCGFIWSTNLGLVSKNDLNETATLLSEPPPGGDGEFSATFSDVRQNETLYFRAFALMENEHGQRRVFAPEITAFSLGEMVTFTEKVPLVINDRIQVEGRLIGWERQGARALTHGFVYSSSNPDPRLGAPQCSATVQDTSASADYDFESQISGLEFNTDYYVRCYALTETDTFYSDVRKVEVKDGWRPAAELLGFHVNGVGVSANGRGYLGLGTKQYSGNDDKAMTRRFSAFDPSANAWAPLPDLSANKLAVSNAVAFSIADTVYVFSGYQELLDGNGVVVLLRYCTNFLYKYLPSTNTWVSKTTEVKEVPGRFGAVAFVLDGKAYVGGGRSYEGNNQIVDRNDFWEFNPLTGAWREVKSLPVRLKDGSQHPDWGRFDAGAFIANGKAYVVGGIIGNTHRLQDHWEFVPPINDQDLGDWKWVGFFLGVSRRGAVTFTVEDRGYYGLGYHLPDPNEPVGYYLDDFWEYSPAKGWEARAPFQGGRRESSAGFGIGAYGFAGGGLVTELDSTQTFPIQKVKNDFWQYTPAKK